MQNPGAQMQKPGAQIQDPGAQMQVIPVLIESSLLIVLPQALI